MLVVGVLHSELSKYGFVSGTFIKIIHRSFMELQLTLRACTISQRYCALQALDYLHYNKVVHGDLKPENVLMSARGSVTLSDFGCSKVIISGNEYLERCNGTPAFLAPEMMRPQSRYR